MEVKSETHVFGGVLLRFTHQSSSTKTPMTCSIFLPKLRSQFGSDEKVPVLMYLSGLSCTDENVCQKSGAFKLLCEKQIAFVAPDTSPRGANIPGENENWDFGLSAGFYVDATVNPWRENYNMYSYITSELPTVLASHFPQIDISRMGITGHSMGGHGALTIALKNQDKFRSVSAFAPICNPINCPWGKKAFSGYLGENTAEWLSYDACELLKARGASKFDNILVDVGTGDKFLSAGQLLPEALEAACASVGQRVEIRMRDGFDHSYFFVASFIDDHINFHAKRLMEN